MPHSVRRGRAAHRALRRKRPGRFAVDQISCVMRRCGISIVTSLSCPETRALSTWRRARGLRQAALAFGLALGLATALVPASLVAAQSRPGAAPSGRESSTTPPLLGAPPRLPSGEGAESRGTSVTHLESCASELAGVRVVDPEPDYDIDNTMADYGDSGKGWSGGDGGQSIKLPDGRIVWLDDDIYIGKVIDNARPHADFLHNAFVVQTGHKFTTLYGVTIDKKPTSFMTYNLTPGYWYWSEGAIVSDGTLDVAYASYYFKGRPSVFGFVRTGTILARFSLTKLQLESVTPLSTKDGILWGVSLLNKGDFTYMYGTRVSDVPYEYTNYLYIARALKGGSLSQWEYFTGKRWVDDAAKANPLTNDAAPNFSVTALSNVYVLTTMEDSWLSNKLVVYFSCSPTGPFGEEREVYTTTGQGGPYGTNGISGVYTYGASAHPELTSGDRLLISYDVNSSDWGLLNTNVNIVRPRYVTATIRFSGP